MRILIETIPHSSQRYPTCGDWQTDSDGTKHIYISETGNDDYNFLLALHEMIEQKLCDRKGITDDEVTKFDKQFEEARSLFPDIVGDTEPGDSLSAPYHNEHGYATTLEMHMAPQLGVDIGAYQEALRVL